MIATDVTTKTVKIIAIMNSFGAMSFMLVVSLKSKEKILYILSYEGVYVKA